MNSEIEYITILDESGRIPKIPVVRTPSGDKNEIIEYCKVDHEKTDALIRTMIERKLSFNSP